MNWSNQYIQDRLAPTPSQVAILRSVREALRRASSEPALLAGLLLIFRDFIGDPDTITNAYAESARAVTLNTLLE